MNFTVESNEIYYVNEENIKLAYVKFPSIDENTVMVTTTYVSDVLRGQGIAGRLMNALYEELKRIVFVGRVSRAKGAFELYELAKRLPHINFELIGEISDEFSNIDQPDNVVTTGPMKHDDLINHLDNLYQIK